MTEQGYALTKNNDPISKRRKGRPSKLKPEITEKYLNFIRAGLTQKSACAACGIDHSTVSRWLIKGENSTRGAYREFFTSHQLAVVQSEVSLLKKVQDAASKDWRAASWLLSKRFPEQYAETHRVDVKVAQEIDAIYAHLEMHLEPDVFLAVIKCIASRAEGV